MIRSARAFSVPIFLLCAVLLSASDRKKFTDAENDGLSGPVKSVSSNVKVVNPQPTVPLHSWVDFGSVLCWMCAYDGDGDRVLRGQDWGTGFTGETTRSVSDESGKVRAQIIENEKGEVVRHIAIGPFGITELKTYSGGALQARNTFRYDQDGHVVEASCFGLGGVRTGHSIFRRDEKGRTIEQWNFGPNGSFLSHFTDMFDPETGIRTFTQFAEDMAVRLTYIATDSKVLNYWQQRTGQTETGETLSFDSGSTQRNYDWYNPDGSFVRTTIEFADDTRRDPIHAEFHDEHDLVQLTADYEYEFDRYHNWIKRTVQVWTPELGEKRVIRIDKRMIEYWQK